MATATGVTPPILVDAKRENLNIDTTFVDEMLKKYQFPDNGREYKTQLAEARSEMFSEYL
jgi:hypothetical protein